MRLHLHLYDRGAIIRDREGCDCADVAAARAVAIAAIRDVLAADVREGSLNLTGSIAICDADEVLLATVPFCDAVTIVLDK